MDIKDYKFNVGDEVITVDGECGKIIKVCNCDKCIERGFLEPVWMKEGSYEGYIIYYDAIYGFSDFYKIGKYRFNDFDKEEILWEMADHEKELKRLKKKLRAIEELEEQYGSKD